MTIQNESQGDSYVGFPDRVVIQRRPINEEVETIEPNIGTLPGNYYPKRWWSAGWMETSLENRTIDININKDLLGTTEAIAQAVNVSWDKEIFNDIQLGYYFYILGFDSRPLIHRIQSFYKGSCILDCTLHDFTEIFNFYFESAQIDQVKLTLSPFVPAQFLEHALEHIPKHIQSKWLGLNKYEDSPDWHEIATIDVKDFVIPGSESMTSSDFVSDIWPTISQRIKRDSRGSSTHPATSFSVTKEDWVTFIELARRADKSHGARPPATEWLRISDWDTVLAVLASRWETAVLAGYGHVDDTHGGPAGSFAMGWPAGSFAYRVYPVLAGERRIELVSNMTVINAGRVKQLQPPSDVRYYLQPLRLDYKGCTPGTEENTRVVSLPTISGSGGINYMYPAQKHATGILVEEVIKNRTFIDCHSAPQSLVHHSEYLPSNEIEYRQLFPQQRCFTPSHTDLLGDETLTFDVASYNATVSGSAYVMDAWDRLSEKFVIPPTKACLSFVPEALHIDKLVLKTPLSNRPEDLEVKIDLYLDASDHQNLWPPHEALRKDTTLRAYIEVLRRKEEPVTVSFDVVSIRFLNGVSNDGFAWVDARASVELLSLVGSYDFKAGDFQAGDYRGTVVEIRASKPDDTTVAIKIFVPPSPNDTTNANIPQSDLIELNPLCAPELVYLQTSQTSTFEKLHGVMSQSPTLPALWQRVQVVAVNNENLPRSENPEDVGVFFVALDEALPTIHTDNNSVEAQKLTGDENAKKQATLISFIDGRRPFDKTEVRVYGVRVVVRDENSERVRVCQPSISQAYYPGLISHPWTIPILPPPPSPLDSFEVYNHGRDFYNRLFAQIIFDDPSLEGIYEVAWAYGTAESWIEFYRARNEPAQSEKWFKEAANPAFYGPQRLDGGKYLVDLLDVDLPFLNDVTITVGVRRIDGSEQTSMYRLEQMTIQAS